MHQRNAGTSVTQSPVKHRPISCRTFWASLKTNSEQVHSARRGSQSGLGEDCDVPVSEGLQSSKQQYECSLQPRNRRFLLRTLPLLHLREGAPVAPGRYCRGRRDVATMSSPRPPVCYEALHSVCVQTPGCFFPQRQAALQLSPKTKRPRDREKPHHPSMYLKSELGKDKSLGSEPLAASPIWRNTSNGYTVIAMA